jgi:hypothetical protein
MIGTTAPLVINGMSDLMADDAFDVRGFRGLDVGP